MALNKQEVKDRVIPIVSKYLEIDKNDIDLNTYLAEYGMNSILAVEIMNEISKIYPSFDSLHFRSINEIVDEIVRNS